MFIICTDFRPRRRLHIMSSAIEQREREPGGPRTPGQRGRIPPRSTVPRPRGLRQTSVGRLNVLTSKSEPITTEKHSPWSVWPRLCLHLPPLQARSADTGPRTRAWGATAARRKPSAWLMLFIKDSVTGCMWRGGPLCLCVCVCVCALGSISGDIFIFRCASNSWGFLRPFSRYRWLDLEGGGNYFWLDTDKRLC